MGSKDVVHGRRRRHGNKLGSDASKFKAREGESDGEVIVGVGGLRAGIRIREPDNNGLIRPVGGDLFKVNKRSGGRYQAGRRETWWLRALEIGALVGESVERAGSEHDREVVDGDCEVGRQVICFLRFLLDYYSEYLCKWL